MSFSDFFWLLSTPTWVSHSQRFIMSFDEASKLFSAPAWANHSQPHFPMLSSWSCLPLSLGNLEKHVALASFRSISGYIATKSGSKVEAEQQCSRRLGMVPFAEHLQSNLKSTLTRWLARLLLVDCPLILELVMTAPSRDHYRITHSRKSYDKFFVTKLSPNNQTVNGKSKLVDN
ncbi:hypothetical protein Bca101_100989 [Brassica carinata]